MEALIVALFALAAIVLLDAGYWIAISLARWAPLVAIGALAGWLANRHGVDALEAIGVGVLASLLARHLMRPRHTYDDGDFL